MPYVTSFERIGHAKGLAEGKRESVRRMVERRFGAIPQELDERIAVADQASLDEIIDRIFTASSPEDLLPAD